MMAGRVGRRDVSFKIGCANHPVKCSGCGMMVPQGTDYYVYDGEEVFCKDCYEKVDICIQCYEPFFATGKNQFHCQECGGDDVTANPSQPIVEPAARSDGGAGQVQDVASPASGGHRPVVHINGHPVDLLDSRTPLITRRYPLPMPMPPWNRKAEVVQLEPARQSLPPVADNGGTSNGGKVKHRRRVNGDDVLKKEVRKTYTSNLADYRIKECGHVGKDVKPVVIFEAPVWSRMMALLRACSHEWLGYLMGEEEKPDQFLITGIVIPKQKVSGGSCENLEAPPADAIGIVHSHHNMFASHSSIDDTGIDIQNRVSVVVSTKGHSVTVKKELPCGKFIVVNGIYDVTVPRGDIGGFVEESVAKMEKDTYAYNYNTGYDYQRQNPGDKDSRIDEYGQWGM